MGFWTGLVEGLALCWEGLAQGLVTLWRRDHGLSVAEREQEVTRLQGLLSEVRAQQERERREYAERERIIADHPGSGDGFPPDTLRRKLENLKRVREGRLQALEQEYLRHLERLGAGQDKR